MHVGESHRGHLGTGSVDLQGFFHALARSGYSGPITFESFSSRVVSPTLSNTLCVWRDLCVPTLVLLLLRVVPQRFALLLSYVECSFPQKLEGA